MQEVTTTAEEQTNLEKMEQTSEEWPKYIRLGSLIIQRCAAEIISPLLMIGLILSMGNYLLRDAIFATLPGLAVIWVIVQVVAIDANMGLMIAQAVQEFHKREWIKGALYLLIALCLLFVAAVIFNTEALQSAIGHQVGTVIPVEYLTIIRSAAIVALVAINQLGAMSLRVSLKMPGKKSNPGTVPQSFPIEGNDTYKDGVDVDGNGWETSQSGKVVAINQEQLQRLSQARGSLIMAGEEITVGKLRERSGVRNEVASAWLRMREQEIEKINSNGHAVH